MKLDRVPEYLSQAKIEDIAELAQIDVQLGRNADSHKRLSKKRNKIIARLKKRNTRAKGKNNEHS